MCLYKENICFASKFARARRCFHLDFSNLKSYGFARLREQVRLAKVARSEGWSLDLLRVGHISIVGNFVGNFVGKGL